ncbi:MAG: hypothetical protein COA49_02675 [Bacteroidetes bacterium]|nr:MAG: hypothetical protein COA49_02675 [Bacteroidota bacterium]
MLSFIFRIKHRWEAIDQENQQIQSDKIDGVIYKPMLFENGDSRKQLLARSRLLLYKAHENLTESQKSRAEILFNESPEIKQAYDLSNKLRALYNNCKDKSIAMTRLMYWYNDVEKSGFKSFRIITNTITHNYREILNYFDIRSINAAAGSFNAKIKAFRMQLRSVRNKEFFLFRLTQIYA